MSPASTIQPLSSIDLVEGFHLAQAVYALLDLNVLEGLQRPSSATELAVKLKLDAELLQGILEYIAARTDLLRKRGSRFVATKQFSESSRFLINLYAGVYRNNATELKSLLRHPSKARKSLGSRQQAKTFVECPTSGQDWL